MILINANKILQELSEIEESISFFEKIIEEQHLDVDIESLIHQVISQNLFKN